MKICKLIIMLFLAIFFTSCIGNMNPTGGNSVPNYPYFITTTPMVVKKIAIPVGTKLVYEEQFFKTGEQDKMLSESKLTDIKFPEGFTMVWGGVPVTSIERFLILKCTDFLFMEILKNYLMQKKQSFLNCGVAAVMI